MAGFKRGSDSTQTGEGPDARTAGVIKAVARARAATWSRQRAFAGVKEDIGSTETSMEGICPG